MNLFGIFSGKGNKDKEAERYPITELTKYRGKELEIWYGRDGPEKHVKGTLEGFPSSERGVVIYTGDPANPYMAFDWVPFGQNSERIISIMAGENALYGVAPANTH